MQRFVADRLAPAADAIDRTGRIPPELLADLAALGAFGWMVDAAHGGASLSSEQAGARLAEIGGACSSVRAVLTAHLMVCAAIARWGSAAQREAWLPALAAGRCIGAFALTEPEHGSDAAAIATRFEPAPGGLRVTGAKRWITGGIVAGLFLVFGRLGERHAAALVPAGTPGLALTPARATHGLRGAMLADADLDGALLDEASRLGPATAGVSFVAMHALDLGRLLVAWGAVGMSRALLRRAFAHAEARVQFGRPLAEHQLIQRRLSDMIAGLRAATLLCESASRLRDARRPEAPAEVLIAKYVAAREARDAARSAAHILGAAGLREGEPAERFLRDSAVLELIEGSTEMSQVMIARVARHVA